MRRVLKFCKNKPLFVVDKAPWYRWVFERLDINVNLRSVLRRMEGLRGREALRHLNLFLKLFMVYFDWFVKRVMLIRTGPM